MNKFKLLLATSMLAVLIPGAATRHSSPNHDKTGHYYPDVNNLYAFNGTNYTELVSSGDLSDGFTTDSTLGGYPATITNASGSQEVLMTYTGTVYYAVYATDSW